MKNIIILKEIKTVNGIGLNYLIKCNECGKEKVVWKSAVDKGLGLYCSTNCYNKNRKKGYKLTKEWKRKISKAHKGKTGLKHTTATKEKISKAFTLENHWNWQGGLSYQPYNYKFNEKLKLKIRKRDNYICQTQNCKTKLIRKLDVHHINYDKQDNSEINLISLCHKCHLKTNYNRKYWTKYFRKLIKKKYEI